MIDFKESNIINGFVANWLNLLDFKIHLFFDHLIKVI